MATATTWETTTVRHGTPSGWSLHKKLNELPCDACYKAKAKYDKDQHNLPEKTRKGRLHARAQQLAIKELTQNHRTEYRTLYLAFKTQLEQKEGEIL